MTEIIICHFYNFVLSYDRTTFSLTHELFHSHNSRHKSKAVPVADRVVRCLRFPYCLDNWLTDGGEVVSLTRRPLFTLQEDLLVLISVRG
jgi:hypothetical protein